MLTVLTILPLRLLTEREKVCLFPHRSLHWCHVGYGATKEGIDALIKKVRHKGNPVNNGMARGKEHCPETSAA